MCAFILHVCIVCLHLCVHLYVDIYVLWVLTTGHMCLRVEAA